MNEPGVCTAIRAGRPCAVAAGRLLTLLPPGQVPTRITGVPSEILSPEAVWPSKDAFAATLNQLGHMFVNNFGHFRWGRAGPLDSAHEKCQVEVFPASAGRARLSNLGRGVLR